LRGLAAVAGWRANFGLSAIGMAALALFVARTIPEPKVRYSQRPISSFRSWRKRRRSGETAYQVTIFATFNLFRTAMPLLLARRSRWRWRRRSLDASVIVGTFERERQGHSPRRSSLF
jgi:hypothetical protein